jgi:S-adenosylmethionine synthetase
MTESMSFYPREMFFTSESVTEGHLVRQLGNDIGYTSPKFGFDINTATIRRPIFRKSATYGHFGREDIDFTWERVDAIDELWGQGGLRRTTPYLFCTERLDVLEFTDCPSG